MLALMLALALLVTGLDAGVAAPGVDVVSAQTAERGTRPDPAEVRPGNRDGDSPSATVGQLRSTQERRILGLPVTAALVIAGVLVGLLLVAGAVIPRARRRAQARGGGTYGRP
jgi:hypothetical protein